jgi:murein DD-endopeptidase MepM/ murein hydrolase activator NlpD
VSINPMTDVLAQMKVAAQGTDPAAAGKPDRERVKQLAAQFESMLLTQMLKGMRESGKWDDDEDAEAGGLGAEAFFETIDAELANHLSSAKGLGLQHQLIDAFERMTGVKAPKEAAPVTNSIESPVTGSAEEPATTQAAGALQFAVAPGSVTSSFGWRRDPINGHAKFHKGIDVRAAYGQEIQAAGAGTVVFSGEQKGYGTTVVLEHGNGVRTRYAHLSAADVQVGDEVAHGAVIGRAGKSGRATGTHLHFEVTANGKPVNPADWGLTPPGKAD